MSRREKIEEMNKEELAIAKAARKRAKKEAKRRNEKKGAKYSNIIRFVIVAIVVLSQVAILLVLYNLINVYVTVVRFINQVIAIIAVLLLFGRDWNSAFKMPWIMFILVFPIIGLALYVLLGRRGTTGHLQEVKYKRIREKIRPYYINSDELAEKYQKKDPELYHQLHYLGKTGGYPCYRNTDIAYFSEAKLGLDAQVEALKKAEKFIFMEYYAIEDEEAFGRIKKVLYEKAAAGVEVRVFYDDVGSVGFINHEFIIEMRKHGVNCRVFNPLKPLMVFFMNNRDHRKMTIIDGKVGFTGGYNMANEYFDITHPYGEWKDTGIKLEGEAVKSLTLIFLENWNSIDETDTKESVAQYIVDNSKYRAREPKGIIVPYADGPIDREPLAETAYMNLIRDSKHYVAITTPYLLITDELTRELVDAAKRGVDVRIITPGIPDKKIVYKMSRSYYLPLAKAGVKIYEYKPGFLHSKMCLVDDHMAIVGTVNFDYRSLYHHFEDACLISGYSCLKTMREDFNYMISRSRYVTPIYVDKKHLSPIDTVLRLAAPLM